MELGISGGIVGAVTGALRELGFRPAAEALDGAAIVPGDKADAVLEAAARQLNDDALGLTISRKLPIGSLGLVDYGLTTSATLRDGLRRLARYYGVATQRVRLALVEDPLRARLLFSRSPEVQHSRHWMEFSFAIIAERIRQTVGPEARFDRVRFKHAAPARPMQHDAFFGAPVEFGADEDSLGMPAHLLDSPLRTAAPALGEMLEARMRELGPASTAADPLLERARAAVSLHLGRGSVKLDALAADLGLARRSLQRELQRRGTSHQAILDQVRRERALALLKAKALSISEISQQLGFSEPSAFFRAFRRWTGSSPRVAAQ